ncbi:hypothetical protein A45J_0009 [hot springs metagenome]|uniref:HTH merR-type domain-containing protein n=1 Tax=hot springs metagenome TaxID=433727 RepID=A0A5J4KSN9_9ZZZZ
MAHSQLFTIDELSQRTGYRAGTIRLMKRYGFFKANEDYIQRTKSNNTLFTEKAVNRLITRREGKIREEAADHGRNKKVEEVQETKTLYDSGTERKDRLQP